jgi:hypothetical protein
VRFARTHAVTSYSLNRQYFPKRNPGIDPIVVQPEFIQKSLEHWEIVEQGLACLSPAQRRVVELLHFEGHTLREISQMEGKELGAIRNSYYRGLKALRTILSEEAGLKQVEGEAFEISQLNGLPLLFVEALLSHPDFISRGSDL